MSHYDNRMRRRTTRVQVEADGYIWRVHGGREGSRWHCHLVELLGPLRLDGPVTQTVRDKIRAELAKALRLEESEIVRISADLILA